MTNLAADLAHFTGTENYTRVSPFFRSLYATDGVMFLANNAGAFWLLGIIGSYLPQMAAQSEEFAVATITKNKTGSGCKFVLDNGNDEASGRVQYATQRIPLSDFPFNQLGNEFKLYIEVVSTADKQDSVYLVMLTSEY